jgi:hypothetical protein
MAVLFLAICWVRTHAILGSKNNFSGSEIMIYSFFQVFAVLFGCVHLSIEIEILFKLSKRYIHINIGINSKIWTQKIKKGNETNSS